MKTQDQKDIEASLKTEPNPTKDIAVYGEADLKNDAGVGMSRVDPSDIRPPQILLIQKSSAIEDFTDTKGNKPNLGQFYDTGKNKIMDSFECYFLVAMKGKYVSKQQPEKGEQDLYRSLGCMADDLSTFGMVFRSSALYALSGLFTATATQKRPMYSIKCKVETKSLQNEKGTWWIPVVRIMEQEQDFVTLKELSIIAKRYDRKIEILDMEDETETKSEEKSDIPF